MGRQGETYGEDPTLAAAMGVAYTKGCQDHVTAGRRTESVAKHFLAFHNSEGGIHGSTSNTPTRLLDEVYGKPFQAAITEADLKGIMPCYCLINGEPASASSYVLTDLLRKEMGFDGVCVSDYGAVNNVYTVQGVGETSAEAGAYCLCAGMDMELAEPGGFGDGLKELFATGQMDEKILDRAVLRVLTAKFRMGLFEHPFALDGKELEEIFYNLQDQEISLQSAKESLVLLKNNGVLPIDKRTKKIALIGPHGDQPRKYFGGYTHMCMMESTFAAANSIAGVGDHETKEHKKIDVIPGTNIQWDETEELDAIWKRQKPNCRSILDHLRRELPETDISYAYGYPVAGKDDSGFEEALQLAESADVIILTLGGKHGTCSLATMGEGVDASNINLPECQERFIRRVAALGKPLIGVHFDGRPISSDAADSCLDAILEAWNPAEMAAEAVVSALLGDYNPGGKMPVTTARNAGQIPIYYNHAKNAAWHQSGSIGFADYVDLPHTPRYYFGHGLSYTKFAYDQLKIDPTEIMPEDSVIISCTVKNVGNCSGDEVVQLYLSDPHASISRPIKELAGFVRMTLQPGEKKRVCFEVQASQLAFLDRNMRWKIEGGEICVEVGSSSEDIRLRDSFLVMQDTWLEGRGRGFYAKVWCSD